jgi:hypothetical protein
MMKMKLVLIWVLLLQACSLVVSGQANGVDSLMLYMHGLRSPQGALLLNIKGYDIIVSEASGSFSKPWFSKMFPGFGLHKGYKSYPDSSLGVPGYRAEQEQRGSGYAAHFVGEYYFFEKGASKVVGIAIAGYRVPDLPFKRALARLVLDDKIADSLLSKFMPPGIRFADRNIDVDYRCQWRGSAAIQCSGLGEMNWSLHASLAEAERETLAQKAQNAELRKLEIEQEEQVTVLFEGKEVSAIRQRLRAKGFAGVMTQMEGSRILIVYYVSSDVRGRFVSCVMSHWTSDYLENGLPPLLNTVMRLKG